jgi:hypothetical protein
MAWPFAEAIKDMIWDYYFKTLFTFNNANGNH